MYIYADSLVPRPISRISIPVRKVWERDYLADTSEGNQCDDVNQKTSLPFRIVLWKICVDAQIPVVLLLISKDYIPGLISSMTSPSV